MEDTIRNDIRGLIEEMDVAYNDLINYQPMNTDYAGFASMAVGQFRDAMRDPALTREDLGKMLRQGMQKHRMRGTDINWTKFVASYMAKSANA